MSEYTTELRQLVESVVPEYDSTATDDQAREVWAQLCELGLPRVGTPESRGGSGGSLDDLLVVVESLAGRGVGVPVVESSVADWVISHAQRLDDSPATLALLDGPTGAVEAGSSGAVEDGADSGTLTAELPAVPWARDAALLVVAGPGREALIVDLRHESVEVRQGENLAGESRDTVLLHRTPATPVAAGPGHAAIRSRLALLWSAAVAGAAHGAYRLTKAYVAERRQFGAPLLRIPAVSSGLALMRVQLLQADAALALAREAVATGTNHAGAHAETDGQPAGRDETAAAVAVARITTAQVATEVARLAHQLHGAMGITQEYALHRVTRRLWAWRDAVASERDWAAELGRRAAGFGETAVWTQLTATGS